MIPRLYFGSRSHCNPAQLPSTDLRCLLTLVAAETSLLATTYGKRKNKQFSFDVITLISQQCCANPFGSGPCAILWKLVYLSKDRSGKKWSCNLQIIIIHVYAAPCMHLVSLNAAPCLYDPPIICTKKCLFQGRNRYMKSHFTVVSSGMIRSKILIAQKIWTNAVIII